MGSQDIVPAGGREVTFAWANSFAGERRCKRARHDDEGVSFIVFGVLQHGAGRDCGRGE